MTADPAILKVLNHYNVSLHKMTDILGKEVIHPDDLDTMEIINGMVSALEHVLQFEYDRRLIKE